MKILQKYIDVLITPTNTQNDIPKLTKVCAWCPKQSYPSLKEGYEYTHGMCRKHYKELTIRKDFPISFYIAEFIETTVQFLNPRQRTLQPLLTATSSKYLKRIKKTVKDLRHTRLQTSTP